ncbi:MAG: ABC transporter substrate-binding protein, partial [Candidatus Rokuibacteriota bacterium]
PTPYVHYFIRETGGLLEPKDFQAWRLLHAAPQPYTRERWDDTYNWSVKWNMVVPGATFENIVDNRAWQ